MFFIFFDPVPLWYQSHSCACDGTISLNPITSLSQSQKSPTTPRKSRKCIHWSEHHERTQQPAIQFNWKLARFCPSFGTNS